MPALTSEWGQRRLVGHAGTVLRCVAMNPANSSDQQTVEEFRRDVHRFFHQTLPGIIDPLPEGSLERSRAWRNALFDHGLAAIDYPKLYGGRGLGQDYVSAYREESQGLVPREDMVFGIAVGMAMPTIRDLGSDELKERFLKPGLRGDEIWCQLYSEPGAGSDLASLRTTATLDGDQWVVTGQKVWTSGAERSSYAILLARTDADLPKHRGVTMFILPMDQPGVEVRPLVQMTGKAGFNEVFLDQATVPRNWVVGEVNNGWRPAVALLGHERVQTGTGSVGGSVDQYSKEGRAPIPFGQLQQLATRAERAADLVVRQELARLYSGQQIMGWLGARATHPSIGKLWRTRQGRAAAELAGRLALDGSAAWRLDLSDPANRDADFFAFQMLNCRGMSLGGGTDEIQRNILGERVLGLPAEPGPARDTPFRDLLK